MATAISRTEARSTSRPRSARRPRIKLKKLIIYLFLTIYCVSSLVAFAWTLIVALKTNQEFMGTMPWALPKLAQFQNFANAWNRGVSMMFGNSFVVATVSTFVSVSLSCLAAYPIARIPFRWNQLVLIFFLLGIMIPYMLTAIPLYFIIQSILERITVDSRIILTILYTVLQLPFNTFVMTGFYKTLPTELEEAAAMDGASPLRTFTKIVLPLSTAGFSSLLILNFLNGWNEFYYALIFVKDKIQQTMPLGLFYMDQNAQYAARWVDLFAGMLISAVPVLIVFALLQEQVTKGLTVGALKG